MKYEKCDETAKLKRSKMDHFQSFYTSQSSVKRLIYCSGNICQSPNGILFHQISGLEIERRDNPLSVQFCITCLSIELF